MPRYFKREGRGKGYEDVTREVAALRAEVASWRATAADKGIAARAIAEERDALRAERDALNEEANALSREATRLAAELGRVATERDAYRDELYECQRERDSWNIAVMHMQPSRVRNSSLYPRQGALYLDQPARLGTKTKALSALPVVRTKELYQRQVLP
jgi:hypothetical protein